MEIVVDHKCTTQDEALDKAKKALFAAGEQYSNMVSDVEESWDGYVGTCSFRAKGFKFNVKVIVGLEKICLEGKVPFLLTGYSSKIETMLRESMEKVFV